MPQLTKTNSKYHTGAHNEHRKASEERKLAGWSQNKVRVYKEVKNKAKKCRRDSRKALADKMNMTMEQLRHQHPYKDVHHTKRITWHLKSDGTVKLHCPITHTKLIHRRLNRGKLRDAEILDTEYSFAEQYKRATNKKRSKKIDKNCTKKKGAAKTKRKQVTDKVLHQAVKCMSSQYRTPLAQKKFLEQARRDRNNQNAYSTLTQQAFNRLKSPCVHRNRPKCPVVITTNKNRRTHIAGLHNRTFPCIRLHILAIATQ